eukprot:TRINITY_DN2788_c1_g1_i2.p1 TRINITY_DN2788_c1_g1~~TRINITY_DN2788_c1_g1_i2.p1  ORF type:complete len:388 (+),score=78.71 TRINITY_DN2788_c1_g1_i2:56-1219(+)
MSSSFAAEPMATCNLDAMATLIICVRSVGSALIMASIGVMLSRSGILNKDMSSRLGKISKNVTLPCLFFTQAVSKIKPEMLKDDFYILLLPIIYPLCVGLPMSFMIVRMSGIDQRFRGAATAAMSQGNTTALIPIFSVFSVVASQCGGQKLVSYLSMFVMVSPSVAWPLGSYLLAENTKDDKKAQLLNCEAGPAGSTAASSFSQKITEFKEGFLSNVAQPPGVAAMIGLLCACIPCVQAALVSEADDVLALGWAFRALQKMAAAASPIIMLMMGSSFWEAWKARSGDSLSMVATVALGKMVLLPLGGLAIGMLLLLVTNHSHPFAFYFMCMSATAVPSASNLIVMANSDETKKTLGKFYLAQYLIAPFTLTFWLTMFAHVSLKATMS